MQNNIQQLDGLALSDYLRTLPPSTHRDICDEIAAWITLENWCSLEEPFQTYVGWSIEGENGSYGNGRTFAIEIVGENVSLMQGFDRRNKRVVKRFAAGDVINMRANEARVTYKTFGPHSSMATERGKVREHQPTQTKTRKAKQ